MITLIIVLFSQQAQDPKVKELEEKLKRLEERVQELEEKPAPAPPPQPQSPGLLNPAITVFLNGAGRIDSERVVNAPGDVFIDDRPFVRTVEADFKAAIDPYAEGTVVLALESEAGEEWAMELEEGYALIKRLPILEEAPLGMKLKLGRFRAPIGQDNLIHMHDVPWTTRPLPIAKYLGTEQGEFFECGWNPTGGEVDFFLPELSESLALEARGGVVRAGETALTEDMDPRQPGFYGRINAFAELDRSLTANLGLSALHEGGGRATTLCALDWMVKWRTPERGTYTSLILGGEAFYADRERYVDDDGDGTFDRETLETPFGYFVYAQFQLDWHWYFGARMDWAEEPDDDRIETRVFAAYVTYYTSEFLRFRVGFEHRDSDIDAQDEVNSVFFEINFVIGSHPVEPYWVSR